MRYETNSNSLAVENTENGYLSKTILKGKSVNNLWGAKGFILGGDNAVELVNGKIKYTSKTNRFGNFFDNNLDMLETDTDYTIITFVYKNEFVTGTIFINNPNADREGAFETQIKIESGQTGIFVNKIRTRASFGVLTGTYPNVGLRSYFDNISSEVGKNVELQILVLKGDYTQSPPSYFEGLKSVGDGVENIEVISRNGNLVPKKYKNGWTHANHSDIYIEHISDIDFDVINRHSTSKDSYIINKVKLDDIVLHNKLVITFDAIKTTGSRFYLLSYAEDDRNFIAVKNQIITDGLNTVVCDTKGLKRLAIRFNNDLANSTMSIRNLMFKTNENICFVPPKSDKKIALYKDTDETWKKPILRGINDSIRDLYDSDALKYYKRCEEIVFNGSNDEEWKAHQNTYTNCMQFVIGTTVKFHQLPLCNKFLAKTYNILDDTESVSIGGSNNIHIKILKSKLETQDVEGFKKWMKSNPITVVYELAQEEVYECTPISVASFKYETTWSISSGAICPSSTFETDYTLNNAVNRVKDIRILNGATKDNLKHNLKEQKIEVLDTDDTLTLVNKMSLTPLKKWVGATGVKPTYVYMMDGSNSVKLGSIKVSGLDFRPSKIILWRDNNENDSYYQYTLFDTKMTRAAVGNWTFTPSENSNFYEYCYVNVNGFGALVAEYGTYSWEAYE